VQVCECRNSVSTAIIVRLWVQDAGSLKTYRVLMVPGPVTQGLVGQVTLQIDSVPSAAATAPQLRVRTAAMRGWNGCGDIRSR
jgi:hypothetical protein